MNINLHSEYLHNLFQNKKIPHALIFECESLEMVYDYTFKLISGLFCKSGPSKPCGKCEACIKVFKKIHPDIKTVSPLKGSQFIGINQIREIRRDAYIIPNEQDYKIYVVTPANLLTVEAQNAFIKILESPPRNIIFILIAESTGLLLPTVLSRCEIFKIFTQENNELNSVEFARNIAKLSVSGNKIEMFKIVSSLVSEDRLFIKDVIINISKSLIKFTKQNKDLKLISTTINKIQHLSEVIKFIDENINLNLIISYLSAIL